MRQIDEITLRNASIFELRNVARDVGVLSPTVYKKEELVIKIMKIMKGEMKPELPKSRQGRPPKAGNKIFENANDSFSFAGFDDDKSKREYSFSGFLDGKQLSLANDGFLFGKLKSEFFEDSGFLKMDKNGYGFLFKKGYVADAKEAIHVPSSFIKDFNLREGDFVECTCKKMDTQNVKILTNVENQKDFSSRVSFKDLKIIKTKNLFSFEKELNFQTEEGERNVLLVPNLKRHKEILDSFEKFSKDYSVFCLSLDAMPEDLPFDFDTFYTFAGDSEKKNIFTVELFIERIKRLVEQGKKVIVFVNELMKIVKYQNYVNCNSMFDVKSKSFELCLKLMSLASCYENGGSVTIFALLKQNSSNECYNSLLGELENINCSFVKIEQ